MTAAATAHRRAVPAPTGVLVDDAAALATFTRDGEQTLAALPGRARRDAAAHALAEQIHQAARAARRAFLAVHADAVYDALTEHRSRRLRLDELVYSAAVAFPGLVPTREAMATEDTAIQADKEGREIDQGIFCAAVLRCPTAGRHLIDTMLMPAPGSRALLAQFTTSDRLQLDTVEVERRGDTAHVTFRNAHCLNSETTALIADLETAVDVALLDERVTVGVLRGGPVTHPRYAGRRVFSAGINLKDLRNGRISFIGFLMARELGYVHKLRRGVLIDPVGPGDADRTVSKPWIAAVDGFAIGGGMQLLLAVDRVIADLDAYFSLPAAAEGIVPGVANLRLTRLAGARLARQVILGGRRIGATEPDGRLLCDEAVTGEEMAAAVERAARELSAPAVSANRRLLNLAEEPVDVYREYLAEFAAIQPVRAYSSDVLAKVEQRWQASRAKAGG